MHIDDINYDLPPERIAFHPAARRDDARLFELSAHQGTTRTDARVSQLVDRVRPGDVWVINDTRVRPARIMARKETGGRVELLVLRVEGTDAHVMLRSSKPLRAGQILTCEDTGESVSVRAVHGNGRATIHVGEDVDAFLQRNGTIPLPPYIDRPVEEADGVRYQTVFATHPGAVAAPTAGLHFTESLMETMQERGAQFARITLHVGPGTFQPIRTSVVEEHVLEPEQTIIPPETADLVASAQRVVAVGTTSVRCLEGAATGRRTVRTGKSATNLYITPGYSFQVVDALMTNFHLPQSSLLALVAAFAGLEIVMNAYQEAVDKGFRFYSYGDTMLIS